MKKTAVRSLLHIGWCLLCAGAVLAAADVSHADEQRIAAIEVRNNKVISADTIRAKMKSKIGEPFSQEGLSEDLKRLYATDYFTDVSIEIENITGGIKVIVVVEEKAIIDEIIFDGNRAISDQRLRSILKSKPDNVLSYSLLAQDMNAIKHLYKKKGFHRVNVEHHLDIDETTNRAKVFVFIVEQTRIKIARITILGNRKIKTKKLKKLLQTKPAWLFSKGVFEDLVFEEDIEKLKAFYRSAGFLDVAITTKMEYSVDGTRLFITIEIEEGKRYVVGEIIINGTLAFDKKAVLGKMKLAPGQVFSNRALRKDVINVEWFYYEHGYVNAQVVATSNLNTATGKIDITYNIDSKNIVYVGKIEIQGNTKTKDIVIRRELRIFPGDKFDGAKLKRSKERLYNLGFFEDISFDNVPSGIPNQHDLIVNVKETKTGEFGFGAGYSSIDEFIGFIEVRQQNFDAANFPSFMGGGQDLALKTEIGTVRRDFLLSWTDPWIFGYPYSFGFDLYQTTHSRRRGYFFEETRTGGDIKLGKNITDYLRADIAYKLERVDISDVSELASPDLVLETGRNWISSSLFQLTYDTRDNIFNPTRGYFLTGAVEPVGGFLGGDKDFYKITATGKYYRSLLHFVVVEFKARVGLADSYSDTEDVPIYERFYAGGANTIRGYDERLVSPRDPGSNEPVGGDALVVGNIEAVFPIYRNVIKGAVFYDVGNVWAKLEDFGQGNLRSGTGVGLRVKTPIGPVKLDYGIPLADNYGDKRENQFYFSVSHGF